MIIPARKEHASEMAELHHKYIKSLLRDLGGRMCRVFYETALQSDKNFGFVYIVESQVIGFSFGTLDNSRLFKNYRIYLEVAFALCQKPALIRRFLFHLSNKFPPAPEAVYGANDPQFRGRGIGKHLAQVLHEEFRRKGVGHYEIRIDKDNLPSLSLHQKLGAKIEEEFWEAGIQRFRLINTLSKNGK